MKSSTSVAEMFAVGLLIAFVGSVAAQQAYPNKPIRIIVPYPPGGTIDPLARLIGPKLSERWGQQVIVDNRPGGNSIIGTEVLAKSPPDGYTLILLGNSHVINPNLFPNLPYDPIKDFAPVATLISTEQLLVLHPSVPANNLKELIALAKSKPSQLNYASAGSGGTPHLMGELLSIMAGIKMQHIPYKGGGPALADLLGGQVQLLFQPPASVIPYIKSGRLKGIAISGETRLLALPQVPTFTESGLPGFYAKNWNGILAPAGTPKGIIDKLSTEIAKILTMPDIKATLAGQGAEPFTSTSDQFAALMKSDMARYAQIIKAANIKVQ